MKRPVVTIERFWQDEHGTYGRLTSGSFRCFTVERPWIGNAPYHSCIPAGTYLAKRGTFASGGGYEDLELVDVPNRDKIEVHAANAPSELLGCIAPNEFLKFDGARMVGANSRHTLKALLESFDEDECWIVITDPKGG